LTKLILYGLALAWLSAIRAFGVPVQVQKYSGGEMAPNTAGMLFHIGLDLKLENELKVSKVRIAFADAIKKTKYLIYIRDLSAHERDIWLLPQSRYALIQIKLTTIDNKVFKKNFRKGDAKVFYTKANAISRFGDWQLRYVEKDQLNLEITSTDVRLNSNVEYGMFKEVVVGQSAKVIQRLKKYQKLPDANKKISKKIKNKVPGEIEYFFRLNLFKNNDIAPIAAAKLSKDTNEFKQCYADLLKRSPQGEGKIRFKLVYSRKAKVARKVVIGESDFEDRRFTNCLKTVIKNVRFNLKRSAVGQINMIFSNKPSDDTISEPTK
jgi:hypothetical protein